MNHIVNQSGETIIAIGSEGSHIRNKTKFNITFPKVLEKLSEQWEQRSSDSGWISYFDLQEICIIDGLSIQEYNALIRTALFYLNNGEQLSNSTQKVY